MFEKGQDILGLLLAYSYLAEFYFNY